MADAGVLDEDLLGNEELVSQHKQHSKKLIQAHNSSITLHFIVEHMLIWLLLGLLRRPKRAASGGPKGPSPAAPKDPHIYHTV